MSEEVEKSVVVDPVEHPQVVIGEAPAVVAEPEPVVESLPSAGEQLRSAREVRGMSVAEAAQALMLAPRQIEAIEQDDWTKLPGDTFARGFIRNYARLLKLDSEALLRRNAEQRAAAEAPNIELPQALAAEIPQPSHAKKRDKATMLAAGSMVVVALLVYFLLPENLLTSKAEQPAVAAPAAVVEAPVAPVAAPASGEAAGTGSSMAAPTPVVVPAEPVAAAAPAPAVVPTPAPAPVPAPATVPPAKNATPPAAVAPAPPVKPVTAPTAPTAAVAGGVRLKFNFAQDAWVEVTDKTGQKLISSKNLGGSQREAVGVPPLTVVVGNATHVKLTADGKTIDLAPRSKDDVARLIVQ